MKRVVTVVVIACPHALGLAIPLIAGILYAIGILLTPVIGAVLMSLSTLIVSINAWLLSLG